MLAEADALSRDTKRIHPDRKVDDWDVVACPKAHSHVLLTGRSWSTARAMAVEALGRWADVDAVSSIHPVPPRRGAAASTEAAMGAIGASRAKVRVQGGACQARLVCQRWEWVMVGGGGGQGRWMGTYGP